MIYRHFKSDYCAVATTSNRTKSCMATVFASITSLTHFAALLFLKPFPTFHLCWSSLISSGPFPPSMTKEQTRHGEVTRLTSGTGGGGVRTKMKTQEYQLSGLLLGLPSALLSCSGAQELGKFREQWWQEINFRKYEWSHSTIPWNTLVIKMAEPPNVNILGCPDCPHLCEGAWWWSSHSVPTERPSNNYHFTEQTLLDGWE